MIADNSDICNPRKGHWITYPNTQAQEYGVYLFRKNFILEEIIEHFIINVTADNRYRLFVNGIPILSGPARGDLSNWYYETIDIASFLRQGNNVITALVWNMGEFSPLAQISSQTGFLLWGNTNVEDIVSTDTSWKIIKSRAYEPCSLDNMERLKAYMVVGPGDEIDGRLHTWGWEKLEFDDNIWPYAEIIKENKWLLSPRTIPLLEEKLIRLAKFNDHRGLPITILPNKKISILVDHSRHIVAYPELIVSGGWGASVKLTYAEALFNENGWKGNRNDIDGKNVIGNYDIFRADGGKKRLFRPLWIRAFRYIQLDIITQNETLKIEDFYAIEARYPLEMKASFSSNDEILKEIWNVGWQTARNCAGEAYYDTPYYEQLQYAGDSRIQALISLYVAGEDRLARKCIIDIFHSRIPEGLTQSRYPSRKLQVIPAFSLFWISMIHDYWMHRTDDDFVKSFLPAIIEILNWFKERIDQNKKMLGPLAWWNFVDWDNFNPRGSAPGTENGNSSIVSFHYAYTLNQAADLFEALKGNGQAEAYRALAKEISENAYSECYNEENGLVADTPEKLTYSQHAIIWAVLSDTMNSKQAQILLKTSLQDTKIGQVTYFYRFYLTQALKKAGMANLYYSQLTPWKEMINMGLTTFAEKPEPTRSDCHAWSASPNYDFLATICGIMPASPGFDTVLIRPALGELIEVTGKMPHPLGNISVSFKIIDEHVLKSEIILPESLTGTFIWKDISHILHGGLQYFTL